MRASFRQSGQLADHRSGTLVAERPDEQLAPKMPIFSALALYIAERSGSDPVRLNMVAPGVRNVPENSTPSVCRVEWARIASSAEGTRSSIGSVEFVPDNAAARDGRDQKQNMNTAPT